MGTTAGSGRVAGSEAAPEVIMLVSPVTTPATFPENRTRHIDALLGSVSARGARPPLRYLNWVARTFGSTVAAELERQRRAQYGFCPIGHVRAVRTARKPTGEAIGAQLFCPECERCAA
jgi:hypothetical protein